MKMTIPYNITGKQRKQLAEDISVAHHTIPKYLGYPTCSYQIGDCTLERDGKLIIPECVAFETATALLEHLRSRGYVGEAVETEDSPLYYIYILHQNSSSLLTQQPNGGICRSRER